MISCLSCSGMALPAAHDVSVLASPVDDLASVEEILADISPSSYKIANHESRIYKDECMYCYHTPYHNGGLFVCLKTWIALCDMHMKIYAEKAGEKSLFLQVTSRKNVKEESDEPKDKIKRLAIGVESGFCNDKVEVEDDYHLVIYPHLEYRIPIALLVDRPVAVACERIAQTTSAERLELLQGASNAWDGEMKEVTKHADMKQCANPRQLPTSDWTCDVDGCGLKENLWLNLYDGAIRCGRSQFISEGVRSKGNNHMRIYYDDMKFPLVVKLGTIEESGSADVYSYDEDNSVIDPHLERHLAHFGLNMKDMTKTEKSTIELELDINEKWEWARCQEQGEQLEPLYGNFYTGIINIGSSCYINSVVQALAVVPDMLTRFAPDSTTFVNSFTPSEMNDSLLGQTTKLFSSIVHGEFSKPPPDDKFNGVKPTQFRKVVGKGHVEFSTARQQDAEEYIRHFLDKISSALPAGEIDPTVALRFKQQIRLEDVASGRVRYSEKDDVVLSVPIPHELLAPTTNEATRFSVHLRDCIAAAFSEEFIDGFKSPVTGEAKGAKSSTSMATFPDFLVVQVKRFEAAADYTVKKMENVDVLVDEEMDLEGYRGSGQREGEELLPEEDSTPELPPTNEHYVNSIVSMGFSRNAALKACIATKNQSLDAAADWVMQNIEDSTLDNSPVPAGPTSFNLEQLMGYGFSRHQASYALAKESDLNQAAEWLFNNIDKVPEERVQEPKKVSDGIARYQLRAFISHMGSSPHSGHYVAHVRRQGRWVLYNDEKVALSKTPPTQLAYLYIYQRN